ncbi:MAG: hypothetical protein DRJ15_10170, partial [Bacteroidetes bacterium]
TAYAVIFWIQNIGLLFIPLILGFVLNATNPDVSPNKILVRSAIEKAFKEMLPEDSFTDIEIGMALDKTTGATVDSIVQYTEYIPVAIEEVDTENVRNEIYMSIATGISNIDVTGDKEETLEKIILIGRNNAYTIIQKEKLNITYDYFYDMLIFLGLSIVSLFFAFMLRVEDRKKGYGLEQPNIQK